ncbi:MAG: NAD(P)H-binding protein [Pseudomonadota bacterium]
MKVAIIGATGFVGSPILAETVSRDRHDITAIVRHPDKVPAGPRVAAHACDIYATATLAALLRGHDAVIHAFAPGRATSEAEVLDKSFRGHQSIIQAAKDAGVPRLLGVGGAASLMTAEGVEYIDSSLWNKDFDAHRNAILGTRSLYYLLKSETVLDWVFLAPSVMLRPGKRTGAFREGKDHVLFDTEGVSHISLEDYAVAMVNELEQPLHHRERFTVGY